LVHSGVRESKKRLISLAIDDLSQNGAMNFSKDRKSQTLIMTLRIIRVHRRLFAALTEKAAQNIYKRVKLNQRAQQK